MAETAVPACPNCGLAAPGKFCGECGQAQGPLHLTVRSLLAEMVDELLQLDSKILRTLRPLLFRPGFLTREYVEGRRARYVRPFRLFLVAVVASFLLLALSVSANAKSLQLELAGQKDPSAILNAWADLLPGFFAVHAHRLIAQGGPGLAERLWHAYVDFGPKAQVLAIPLYACLLVAVYRDAKRTYAEHFVFALHFHAFYFAIGCLPTMLAIAHLQSLASTVGGLLGFASWVYLFFALRTVYPRGGAITLWRTLQMVFLNLFVQTFVAIVVIATAVALA